MERFSLSNGSYHTWNSLGSSPSYTDRHHQHIRNSQQDRILDIEFLVDERTMNENTFANTNPIIFPTAC